MYLGKRARLAKVGSREGDVLRVIVAAEGTSAGNRENCDVPAGPEWREGPVSGRSTPGTHGLPAARLGAA